MLKALYSVNCTDQCGIVMYDARERVRMKAHSPSSALVACDEEKDLREPGATLLN